MSLSSLTVGDESVAIVPNKYKGYSVHLDGATSSVEIVNYAISATVQQSGATLSYEMKDAPTSLTVADISGWKVSVDGITDGATGTLCIGVTYQGVTNVYEIGVIVDPDAT